MEWTADQYFREKLEMNPPAGLCQLGAANLVFWRERADWNKKEISMITQEKDDVYENLTATYWG